MVACRQIQVTRKDSFGVEGGVADDCFPINNQEDPVIVISSKAVFSGVFYEEIARYFYEEFVVDTTCAPNIEGFCRGPALVVGHFAGKAALVIGVIDDVSADAVELTVVLGDEISGVIA